MKNIQVIDGAVNATFSVFQATEDEFAAIFPNDQDMELIEDFIARCGEDKGAATLSAIWQRPILKREAQGIHGTLFFDGEARRAYIPSTKREVDLDESSLNEAQRLLFRSRR